MDETRYGEATLLWTQDQELRFWPRPGRRVRAYSPMGCYYGILGESHLSSVLPFLLCWEVYREEDTEQWFAPEFLIHGALHGFDVLDEAGQPIHPFPADGYPTFGLAGRRYIPDLTHYWDRKELLRELLIELQHERSRS